MTKQDQKMDGEALIRQKIEKMAFLLLGNYHDACDLAQEVFFELEKGRTKWELADSKWAWAAGVFHRQFRRFLRIRKRGAMKLADDDADAPSKEPGPERQVIVQEEMERTFAAIRSLNPELAETLLMFAVEELPIREIAQLQNVAEGTIKWRIFEARKRIVKMISEKNTGHKQ